MINKDSLVLALLDFDDTLCIHTYRLSSYDSIDYCESVIHGSEWWTKIGCKTNKHMKEFMTLMKNQGIRLGLISQTDSYLHMTRKNEWIQNNYDIELENFCVSSNASKINMMKALSKAYNIRRDKILIVDDKESVLCDAINNGFQAASPMEVVNFITNEVNKEAAQ